MCCLPKTEGATSKQTRNRAGKTSFVELVHFLLGADAGPDSIFRTPELAEYTFGLDFDLKSERTVVERSGSSKAKIYVTVPRGQSQILGHRVVHVPRRTNVWSEQP